MRTAAIALALAAALPAGAAAAPERVVVSTDLAPRPVGGRFDGAGPAPIDDAHAVALALADPARFDVRGLVIPHGNDIRDPEVQALPRVVSALGWRTPVVAGAAVPPANPPVRWFGGRPVRSCVDDGVRRMARESRGPLTVSATGSLTDVGPGLRSAGGPAPAPSRPNVTRDDGARPSGAHTVQWVRDPGAHCCAPNVVAAPGAATR